MPKRSTSQPVPWGFKVLAGIQVLVILAQIAALFLSIPEVKYFGYALTGAAIPTLIIIHTAIEIAILYAFFNRNKWGFLLLMSVFGIDLLNRLVALIQESASQDHLQLATSIIPVIIRILIIKYIYDRRWYFNR